jgi:Cytochrome P460
MVRPVAVAMSGLMLLAGGVKMAAPVEEPAALSYTVSGEMRFPEHYREWVYLTSGLGMSYQPAASMSGMGPMFDNVFVNPAAYKAFLATGTWPDKTVLVLEVRGSETKVSIDQHGSSQGEVMGIEVHAKDATLPGGWGFFEFDPDKPAPAKIVERPASCYTCHETHGAVDTTFVQFYPTLIPVAKEKKMLSAAYLKDVAAMTSVRDGEKK